MHKWELITLLQRSLIYRVYSLKLSSLNFDWMSCFLRGLSNCPKAKTHVWGICCSTPYNLLRGEEWQSLVAEGLSWGAEPGSLGSATAGLLGSPDTTAIAYWAQKENSNLYKLETKTVPSPIVWSCPGDRCAGFCHSVQGYNICWMTVNFMRLLYSSAV